MVGVCDVSLYVMTSEFGAPIQLEKIKMLDFADLVAINKFEHKGAEDALAERPPAVPPNRNLFDRPRRGTAGLRHDRLPVQRPRNQRALPGPAEGDQRQEGHRLALLACRSPSAESLKRYIIPPDRVHYLGEIVQAVRGYRKQVMRTGRHGPAAVPARTAPKRCSARPGPIEELDRQIARLNEANSRKSRGDSQRVARAEGILPRRPACHPRSGTGRSAATSIPPALSGTRVPQGLCCRTSPTGARSCAGACSRTSRAVSPSPPGCFPSSGPKRIPSASSPGEGTPERTNRRFHYLCQGRRRQAAVHGLRQRDPLRRRPRRPPRHLRQGRRERRQVATLDDMKKLFAGFDLCDPNTSVSHDDQRPRADDPGLVLQRGHRPAGRSVPGAERPRAPPKPSTRRSAPAPCRPSAARSRPTSSRRTRDRTPASSRSSSP